MPDVAVETTQAEDEGPFAAELPNAMAVGDLDVIVNVAFDGWTWSPVSLVAAFVGWNELNGMVELGVVETPDTIVALGVVGWYAQPLIPNVGRKPNVRVGGGDVGFSVWSAGVLARGSLHLTSSGLDWPAPMDPFVAMSVGPTVAAYGIGYEDDADSWVYTGETGVRTTLSGGSRFVAANGFLGSFELGYTAGFPLKKAPELITTTSDGRAAMWARSGAARQPRGFTWSFGVGRRF